LLTQFFGALFERTRVDQEMRADIGGAAQ